MPPAVAAAGIAAAGSLGGALVGRSGQNRALQSQERATMAQLQLERDRDAARQRASERAYASYEREKSQYDQLRRAMLSHYGINIPDGSGATGAGGGAAGGWQTGEGGMSLGQLVNKGGAASPWSGGDPMAPGAGSQVMPGAEPFAKEPDVFDWRNYGVSGR